MPRKENIGTVGYLTLIIIPLILALWYVLTPNDLIPGAPIDDALITTGLIGADIWVNRNYQP